MSSEMNQLRFESFTLDLPLRQLRQGDEVVPLPGKAFDLLAYMVRNPGRPLEKQELLDAVWPGSFVEEGNLSQNVFLVRRALGSGPDGIIVTLPGRGYQFAAVVQTVAPPQPAVETSGAPERGTTSIEATRTRVVLEEETEEHIPAWKSAWVISLSGVALVLVALASWLGWQTWQDRVGGPPVQVVLADPEGSTGDAILDRSLVDGLRMSLAQSPFVTVVSPSLVRQTMTLMQRKPEEHLTADLARDVCERTGSQVVLGGSIAHAGKDYLVTEIGTSCADGSVIASRKAEASRSEELPATLDRLAAQIRHDLGESRRTIARFSVPLFPMKTASIEALKDYSQAYRLSQRGQFPEAIALLKQAVSIDPSFTAAWLDLSTFSANLADHEGDRKYLQRAYDLRNTATAPVRLYAEARYAATITGNLYDALQQFRTMAEIYPRNMVAAAGELQIASELGRHDEAIAAGKRALSINPTFVSIFYGVCSEQRKLGLLAEALLTCNAAIDHHLDSELVHAELFRIGLLQHNVDLITAQEVWSQQHPDAAYLKLIQSLRMVSERRFAEGLQLLDAAVAVCQQRGLPGMAATYRQKVALNLARLGEIDAALPLVKADEVDDENSEAIEALVLLGDVTDAQAKIQHMEQRSPRTTLWSDQDGPAVRAAIDIASGRPQQAVARLSVPSPLLQNQDDLDVMLLRARALQMSHRDAEARTQFQLLVEHQSLDPVSSAITVAKRELGESKVP